MKYKRKSEAYRRTMMPTKIDHIRFLEVVNDWRDQDSLTEDWTGGIEEMPQMVDNRRESIYIKNLLEL